MTDFQTALDEARERTNAPRPRVAYIDNDTYRRQRTALTRAINSGDPAKVQKVVVETVRAWNAGNYAWPDAWARWQIALDDSLPFFDRILLEDIR